MKKLLLTLTILIGIGTLASAQNSFLGIQNSPRKGMIGAVMNPAEINNLDKKIEVNFFSISGDVGNNIISFGDILDFGGDVVDVAFNRANERPVNMRSNINVIGPSVGFNYGKWAFGITTQAFGKADIVDLDPTLGQSILNIEMNSSSSQTGIASNYNQRINANAWIELGFVLGREIFETEKHKLSAGASLKLLFPNTYTNVGLDRFNAVILQDGTEVRLTNTNGTLNLNYPDNMVNDGIFSLKGYSFKLNQMKGVGLDLGFNYQLKDAYGRPRLNAGLAVRNLGSMTFADGQINNTYSINIPENEYFRLDNLGDNIDEIEQQLLDSGYFTKTSETTGIKTSLPSIVSGYAEVKLLEKLFVSAYGQFRTGDDYANEQITAQNLIVITPRLLLGNFEIYSPWSKTDVAGYSGGLGLRYGGFFVGSNSILTGFTADTMQADFHLGLSWGFGRN
ncbi:hypothetical protein ACFSKL_08630 [Belliella marina]|uniref:DUF5723 domain-containing protein n=1 Tax=Belliella marina TaxID=1644146 RepID=A0ABW4VKI7_9BACT